MSDINAQAVESTQETLLAELSLLFKASNLSDNKDEIAKLKKEREKVNQELDRIELAKINSVILPAEIQQAIKELAGLTKELTTEKERIQEITEKLKRADEYLNQAEKVLEISSKLFAHL